MNTESINPIQNTDIIVGLDIGTTKIAVLVGVKNEKGKRINSWFGLLMFSLYNYAIQPI